MVGRQCGEVALVIVDGLFQLGAGRERFRRTHRNRRQPDRQRRKTFGLRRQRARVLREQSLEAVGHCACVAWIADPQPLANEIVRPDRGGRSVADPDRFCGRGGLCDGGVIGHDLPHATLSVMTDPRAAEPVGAKRASSSL
jgi:hypothetical protein